ncbi:HofP DNA utilization family protein [Franconibacter helveticus]|uniref:HofP DNA utilization family protein n=1 Tax=Franconibacter helveticus TaxID=357240 RepID=UPI0029084E47|nr:HofP DNA utilization family protein [Franconibacter helveticus]MDU6925823.1 HofP DNA utilization family protein [Franconibacter helveticus]
MRSEWLLIAALIQPAAAARNPFEPPETDCETEQAAGWRYRGMVGRDGAARGIISTPEGKSLRISAGSVLPQGLRVSDVAATHITLVSQGACKGASQQWKLKEQPNGKETSSFIHIERGKPGPARNG